MSKISQRSKLALSILAAAMAVPAVSQAALVEDSKASLELRNMYLNRDYRDEATSTTRRAFDNEFQSYGEYWGQGFIAKFESGFTEGTVGVGVDAIGLLGVRLDSGKGRVDGINGGGASGGIGMSPLERNGDPVGDYSELGLTGKVRVSKSTLHIGTLMPTLPVVQYNNTRLLPGTYTGGMITSQEVDGLTLHAGRLTEFNLRDSSNNQEFPDVNANVHTENFDFAGGAYAFSPQLTASYYYGDYDNVYKQHFTGLVHKLPLGEGMSLTSDLRYFKSKDQGRNPSQVDNDMYQGMFTLGVGAHKFGLGFQDLSGDGAFPMVAGADPYSINLVTYNIFTKEETDAWQVRYDYDFASLGIPGLTFMTRYVDGTNIAAGGKNGGQEWERDTDIVYTLQEGTLKGLRFHVRNVTYRTESHIGRDVDENRLIVSYTLPLL
ncbi:OprD family porin [Geopseudomonas guangdongensis]|uniref:Outer membrane porin, OprD family n=1 Tax=Geopseudomonas guangdongensis TaxID=1245526 RepID=A0A1H2EHE3_9GAMM|nr:OprD family porin [Pseudomonas guangdongensis]SDT94510.1 outer membrane porin, OprD family [Pseudomonas guangdongensis]